MKKNIIYIALLFFGTSVSAQETTLEQVLENYFIAMGQAKLLNVETITYHGRVMQMGLDMPFIQIQKRPNKSRLEVEMQGNKMIQVFDGSNGWAIRPWMGPDPKDLSGMDLKGAVELGNFDGDFWDWQAKGLQVKLIGKEQMDGASVFNVQVIKQNGDIYNYYFDAENFIILRTKTIMLLEGKQIAGETLLSNYKKIDDMLFAFNLETKYNGQTGMKITFDTIEFNLPYDDSFFAKPGNGVNNEK